MDRSCGLWPSIRFLRTEKNIGRLFSGLKKKAIYNYSTKSDLGERLNTGLKKCGGRAGGRWRLNRAPVFKGPIGVRNSCNEITMSGDKANVLLVGSGGVGTIASVGLEASGRAGVTSVLRSDYDRVKERGFEIQSIDYGNFDSWRPTHIEKSVQEAMDNHGPFNYILVATKVLPEILPTEKLIQPAVTPGKSVIVLIQNGIGIEEPVANTYPENIVLSGVSMVSAHNYSGKVVQHEADELIIGYFDSPGFEKDQLLKAAKEFVTLYSAAGADCVLTDELNFTRWRKLVYNSTINTTCALTRIDAGRSFHSGMEDQLIVPAMREIIAIAKSEGVSIPESAITDMVESDDGVYATPSMMVDVQKGNPMELEVILGNPLRTAKKNGVPTPILSVIYELLKGVQFSLMEARGHIKLPEKGPVRSAGDVPYYKQ